MIPDAFSAKMKELLGAEFPAFMSAYDRPRAVGLRLNPLKTKTFPALPFVLTPVPWAENGFYYDARLRPGLHPWHEAGLYYLQEPSAMAPATLLAPQPGERVLDLCAAPGGKTSQLAAMMDNQGLLVCNEINPRRAQTLSRNVERMGISCALVLNEHPARLARRFAGWFHRVLVDAPCSGEGMFRKEEAAAAAWSQQTVEMCAHRQREILDSGAQMLAPGGRLVYSTCTFSPEENEGVVGSFLDAHPEFTVEQVDCGWFSPGCPQWTAHGRPELCHTFRLWPHKLLGEGHFAAVLRKTGGTAGAVKPERGEKPPPEFLEFCRQTLGRTLTGKPLLFGRRLYLAPETLPELSGLKVLRPGLEAGQVCKGRFEPSHSLALFCDRAAQTADFSVQGEELARYLRGETLPGSASGWTLVTADGLSIGWAKGANGLLKNHFPKALRHF